MSENQLSTWLGEVGEKHGFTGPAGATKSPAPARAAAGPGAGPAADAAEAAAGEAGSVVSMLSPVAAELQAIAQEARTLQSEAAAAKTAADQAIGTIPAAPAVPAPQGADPRARYDSSIQISGSMRTAKQSADARADAARGQGKKAETALQGLEAKVEAARGKAELAKTRADQAARHARAAAEAAKQAIAEAQKSKAAADTAADDAPNEAELQKTAQEDTRHVARARAAAAKAVGAAKEAQATAAGAQAQVTAVEGARDEARQSVDAIRKAAGGVDEKLAGFDQAISQAEAQEAECKDQLAAEDAQTVLERKYAELGGDEELRRALEAEDEAFKTLVETFRANAKNWKQDEIRELDEQKARIQAKLDEAEAIVPGMRAWVDRELEQDNPTLARVNALGEKLKTEPGKEVQHEARQNHELVNQMLHMLAYNERHAEQTREMMTTLEQGYEDADAAYEAAEKYIDELQTELDNELQMSAMTLDQKVDFLQKRPRPVRDRIQGKLDTRLEELRNESVTATTETDLDLEPEKEPYDPPSLDWGSLQAKIADVESKSLEELQGKDPELVAMEEEYEAAGGDEALFDKRVAEWKAAMAEAEKEAKERSERYLKESRELQVDVNETGRLIQKNEDRIAGKKEKLEASKKRLSQLMQRKALVGQDGLTPRERAELTATRREVERLEQSIQGYEEIVAGLETKKASAEKLRDQHEGRYEDDTDDDAAPAPEKPESSDVRALPLRVKYEELLGKAAPA